MSSSSSAIDNESHYRTLGLDSKASAKEIKKTFRVMALKHHPDRGGDEATFKKINAAHEILSDSKKRALYDEGGDKAVERGFAEGEGGGGGMNGWPFNMQQRQQPPRDVPPATIKVKVPVTLAELYRGTTKYLSFGRETSCGSCKGKGGTGTPEQCAGCKGQGVRIMMRSVGPGMMQQLQAVCSDCKGAGESFSQAARCAPCKGVGTTAVVTSLEIVVRPGHLTRVPLLLREQGHESPKADVCAGDVQVHLDVRDANTDADSSFRVQGKHLIYYQTLSLLDALTGKAFDIPHIRAKHDDDGNDGANESTVRTLRVRAPRGAIVRPDSYMLLPGEGMPHHDNPSAHGDLLVKFKVEFPPDGFAADEAQRSLLRRYWPSSSTSGSEDDTPLPTSPLLAAKTEEANSASSASSTLPPPLELKVVTYEEASAQFMAEEDAIVDKVRQFQEECHESGMGQQGSAGGIFSQPGCQQQ